MRKIYCTKCTKYKEFKNSKISHICYKTLLLSSICNKCWNENEKIIKEEESIEILKWLVWLIICKKKSNESRKHNSKI